MIPPSPHRWIFWVGLALVGLIVCYCFHRSAEDAARQAERDVQLILEDESSALTVFEETADTYGLDRHYFPFIDEAMQVALKGYKQEYGLEAAVAFVKDQKDVPPRDRVLIEKVLTERMAASRVLSAQSRKESTLERCQNLARTTLGNYFAMTCPPEAEVLPFPSLVSRLTPAPETSPTLWGSEINGQYPE